MNQVEAAALTLTGITLAFLSIVYLVWRMRQPATAHATPRAPKTPKLADEGKFPKLSRKERRAVEEPVAIAPSRLARISGKPPFDRLNETGVAPAAEPPAAPTSAADRATADAMLESMVAQVEHEADLIERRGTEAVAVRIVPQIPPRGAGRASSWLGGHPRLGAGMAWPEIREEPADFLAQIDCADLPRDLWDGLGPRSGALAFFIHPRYGDMLVFPVAAPADPVEPPRLRDEPGVLFAPHGGLRFGDLMPFSRPCLPRMARRSGRGTPRRSRSARRRNGGRRAGSPVLPHRL